MRQSLATGLLILFITGCSNSGSEGNAGNSEQEEAGTEAAEEQSQSSTAKTEAAKTKKAIKRENPFSGKELVKNNKAYPFQLFKAKKRGESPEKGDVLELKMVSRTDKYALINTVENKESYFLKFEEPAYRFDILHALGKMKEGDSASYAITASDLFRGNVQDPLKERDTVFVNFRLLEVRNEQEEIETFRTNSSLDFGKVKDGLFLAFEKKGEGKSLSNGDSLVIHFSIQNLNGKTLNSSFSRAESMKFTLGEKALVKAWQLILPNLKEGDEAYILCHSKYAFGSKGALPKIPPYSPLLYFVQIKEVVKQN